jgi:hypothetical protein
MTSKPTLARRLAPLAALVAALAAARSAGPQPVAPPSDAAAFLDEVARTWNARDESAWMALWDLPEGTPQQEERLVARAAFAGDVTSKQFVRRPSPEPGASRFDADAQVFTTNEPRARIEYWRFTAEKRGGRWALVERQSAGQVDGLVHLSLGREALRARNAALRLVDFELLMEDGTLYSTPRELGPTALVFVGRGRVRFAPPPAAEREQLRQYMGQERLDQPVGWAYVRLHPADYGHVLATSGLVPEPSPERHREVAERVFRERADQSFQVEADLPRSPWWLMPGVGDAVVDFPAGRRRVLTYALSGAEFEDVNLFDRARKLQVCMYSSAGRERPASEDDGRSLDVLEQHIAARFDPDRFGLQAVHTMKVRLLDGSSTVRLRLHQDLAVASVTTADGTRLLHLRVRNQDSVVVSLGRLAAQQGPITLVTRYGGRHDPAPVEDELLQVPADTYETGEVYIDRPPLVYANRTAWYPRPPDEDFALTTASFDTPEGWLAVTGGELVAQRTEGRRTRTEFRLTQPGKFVTAVVGRLTDVGMRQEGAQAVRGFATPRTKDETLAQMQTAQEMLAFYAERFGPPPYPSLGLVVAEAHTPGGHSPPGLIYVQKRPAMLTRRLSDDPANFSDVPGFFVAHEAAHQWWGQGTAPSSYREKWISEGWAQYSSALWVRERSGEAAFRRMMDRMAEWALRHDALGPIDLGQRLGHLRGDGRVMRAIVYNKGAWVLHMLRGIVGDEAFFAGARAFLDAHRYQKAGSRELRQALERASGRELGTYFERWVYDTGLPVVRWSAAAEPFPQGFRTTFNVQPAGLPGPVPLEVGLTLDGERVSRRVTLEPSGGSFTLGTHERPRSFDVNVDRGLLARFERVSRLARPAQ